MEGGNKALNNVENRIVEMKFDNAQFEAAVAKTMQTLDKFKEKLNFENVGNGFNKLGTITDNYSGTLSGVGNAIEVVKEKFGSLSGIGERVFSTLTSAATGFLTSGINKLTEDVVQGGQSRAMNLEQAKFQLQGILGDAQEVNRVIYDDILPELQGTPFSLDQAAVVMGQLAASGKTTSEEIQQGTRAIAGAAAMTNSSFAEMGRIFTKVAGNGRVMGDTLQEMSSRGLNAAADMGKVFGMTEAEVREAVTAGKISYDMFAEAMDQLYGEQAQKSTTMYTGALEDLRAALARIGAEPQAVKLELLRDAFNALVPAVDAVNAVLKPWINSAHETEEYLDENGEMATRYAKAFKGPLAQSIQQTGWAFQSLFVKLDDNHDILRYTSESLKDYGYEVEEAADGTKSYFEILEDGTKVYHDVGEAVMNHSMLRIMTSAAQSFVNVVAAIGKVLKAVGEGMIAAFPKVTLKNIADLVDGVEKFTKALVLSDDTLSNIRFVVQAIMTPFGLLARVLGIVAKVLVELGKLIYHAVAPGFKVLFSLVGGVSALFSGLGKAVDHAASDVTVMASKLFSALKTIAKFLKLDKAVGLLQTGLEKLSHAFTVAGEKGYQFLFDISSNLKKFASYSASKLHLDKIGEALERFKTRLKGLWEATGHLGLHKIENAFKTLKESVSGLIPATISLDKVKASIKKFGDNLLSAIPTEKVILLINKIGDYIVKLAISISILISSHSDKVIDFFRTLGNVIANFIKYIKYLNNTFGIIETLRIIFLKLINMIPKLFGFKDLGSMFDSIKDKIKGFVDIFRELMAMLVGGAKGGAKNFGKGFKNGLDGIIDDKLTGKLEKFSEVLKTFGKLLSESANGIGKKLSEFYKALESGDKNKIIAALSMLVIAFSYIRTINKYHGMVAGVKKTIDGFAIIGKAITSIGSGIRDAAKTIKRIGLLIGISTSLLIFAVSLSILSKMNTTDLVQGTIAAVFALIALAIALRSLNKISVKDIDGKKLLNMGLAMAAIGAAVLMITKSMEKLSEIYRSNSIGGYLTIIATLAGMLIAFGILAKQFSKMDKMEVSLKSAGIAMLAIATSIKMMVNSMAIIGAMDTTTLLKGGGVIAGLLILMTVLARVAGKNKNVASAAKGMAILTASLLLLRVAIGSYAKIDPIALGTGLLKIAASLVVLLAIFTIFKNATGPQAAGGILAMSVALGILSGVLIVLAAIPLHALGKALFALVVAIIAVGGAIGLLSGLGPGMLLVAAAFALLGLAMVAVGGGVMLLTLALSSLIPLLILLGSLPSDRINDGLEVLVNIADKLGEAFHRVAAGLMHFAAALLVAAVAVVILSVGVIALGVGFTVCGIGLLALAGGLATIALVIDAFFGGSLLESISNAFETFGSKIMTGLGGLLGKVKTMFTKEEGGMLVDPLLSGANESAETSGTELEEKLSSPLKDGLANVLGLQGPWSEAYAQLPIAGAEGLTSNSDELVTAQDDLFDQLSEGFENNSSDYYDYGSENSGQLLSGFASNIPLVGGTVGRMTNSMVSAEKKGDHRGAGRTNIQQFVNGAKSVDVKGPANQIGNDAVPPDKSDDANDVGKGIVDGLVSGINDFAYLAENAGYSLGQKTASKVKEGAKQNSPSKITIEVGIGLGEGLIVGMNRIKDRVLSVGEDLGEESAKSLSSAMKTASKLFDSTINYTPTITPVVDMSNVRASASGINALLGPNGFTIKGNANFDAISASIMATNQNEAELLEIISYMSDKIEQLGSVIQNVQPDYERISSAVEHGASRATLGGVSLNGRELKRGLKDMGVVTR